MNQIKIGKKYEEKAADYLTKQGMRLIEQNFRSRYGEIDIIGIHNNCLVFVEVKYRRNNNRGIAEEAVGVSKQKKICFTSDYFRISRKQYLKLQVRYDVVAMTGDDIRWHQNAFPYQGNGGW